ncbi:ABC transporter substrate-binding protein [Frankia sp. AgB1.9]|uniref:ABC transporter substrate-binding protein n=1 Tax=unclassified Frankia TaxID=2632575 RepID=UPI001932E1D7|nr:MULTISPECIES: ABC transporter substrate-binding protein [unclassified Frankia]MBL7486579.1 ABC transporter substrate-binding protein [Frankia sp. AgW1.1]MBL7550482.1 ABC transporter substrate-binding protein [Frankia sp. AgB1.9]MBL7624321.1 ABC transporter substrate-binding protein [Frankia sp. AgB1.8]
MDLRRTGRLAILAVAAATALAVAGCSTTSKKDAPVPAPTATLKAAPAPAISPGVTADSIKIGFVYPDLSVVKQYVNVDHGDYQAVFTALVDKVNAAGGINGRKIVPVFGAVNVISPAGAQDTCVHLTQDEKVFAVIGSLNADDALCYVQIHKTLTVGGDLNASRYLKAQAPWFSDLRGGDAAGDGLKLFDNGGLKSKKVAVIGYKADQYTMNSVVAPALKKLGVTPVATAVMDAPITDPAAVAQQTGVFVQKFQSVGADAVIVVGGASGSFPAQLEKATSYRPQLLFTDQGQASAYSLSSGKHDFSTLNNAQALGIASDWNNAPNQACIATAEAAIPSLKGTLLDPTTIPTGKPTFGTSENVSCRYLDLFTAIAQKAGKNLTYASFQQAAFSLGSFVVPGGLEKANYTPGNPGGAVPLHLFKYDPTLQKWALSTS